MARFFFSIHKSDHRPDKLEVEFADVGSARLEAVRVMSEELRSEPDEFCRDETWRVEITDEQGQILFSISADAVEPREITPLAI